MSGEQVVVVVVLVWSALLALKGELDRPRRRARWDRLLQEAIDDKAKDGDADREEWRP